MRAWIKRRYLWLRIRAIQRRLNRLATEQQVLELALRSVNQDLGALAAEWKALRSQVVSQVRPAGGSIQTIPPTSNTCAPKTSVASSARPVSSLH